MAKNSESGADAPILISFQQFVDYGFAHWLKSLKTGTRPKTLCLLGSPGIGKSATAKELAKRMTDYVRQNPAVIFGVNSLEQAVKLLNDERDSHLVTKTTVDLIGENMKRTQPLDNEGLDKLIETTVALKRRLLQPITQDHVMAVARLLDFSSMLPEDLNGLPFRSGDETLYCPQRWVHELCGKYAFGVVVQDDLPAAAPAMHTAGRQMALERRIHDHNFSNGVLIVVTGNRRQDKANAQTLPSHFRNSVVILQIEPDVDAWKKWYGKQEHHDQIVASFLTWQPGLFTQTPGEDDKAGAFASPRQWASLGQQFATANELGADVLYAVAAGLVGKPVATTFSGFVEVYSKLPDPEKVLDNPKGMIPKPSETLATPDKQIAMTCALGDIAAKRWKKAKGNDKNEVPVKLMRALAHVCEGIGEYSATGVQTFLDSGGNLTAIAKVARDYRSDAVIGPMLDHVKDALLGGA